MSDDVKFDKEMAEAAKSNQVSQFSEALDELDDLSEDDEVISEFLQGLESADQAKRSAAEGYEADDDIDSFDELAGDSNDLFDELFDEEDTYESSEEEAKNSILKAIRNNPIKGVEKQGGFESEFDMDDIDLPLKEKKVPVSSNFDAASITHSIYPPAKSYTALALGGISLCLVVGLAVYSFFLGQHLDSLKISYESLRDSVEPMNPVETQEIVIIEVRKKLDQLTQRLGKLEKTAQNGTQKETVTASEQQAVQMANIKKLNRSVVTLMQDMMKLEGNIEKLQEQPVVKEAIKPVKVVRPVKKIARKTQKVARKTQQAGSQLSQKWAKKNPWIVNIVSYVERKAADDTLKDMLARGIDAEKVKVTVKGRVWYRLRVVGFADKASAQRYVKRLRKLPDVSRPWITKR